MNVNKKEPIPAHFNSAEEAGEFWDTHSAADYWDNMDERIEIEFDLQERTYLVPITTQIYHHLKERAAQEQDTVAHTLNDLLTTALAQ